MWQLFTRAFAAFTALGCAASAAPAASATEEPAAAPLQKGELIDFVPAAGLRWLMSGSPRYFAEHPALAPLRERWLTAARLQAFAKATGIDLARTERALVAGFDLGTLYLVDASGWVQKPELPFIERLAGSARVQRTHPEVWRVTGLVGSTPQALVRLDDALVAVAVRDPMLARLVEYRARGRLRELVPALRGASLSALPAEYLAPGPLRAYALGPFSERSLPAGVGLIAAASALAAALELEGSVLRLRVVFAGQWDGVRDPEQLRSLWQAVSSGAAGSALGLDQSRAPVSVEASERVLSLAVELDAARVLAGLEGLAAGRFDALLGPASGAQGSESPH